MTTKPVRAAFALSLVLAIAPGVAHADTYLSPFIGLTFGGDAREHAPVYGLSVAFLGPSAGLEVEYGQSSDFFGDQVAGARANVTTLMANYFVGGNPQGRGVKFYALTGAGLIRTRVDHGALLDDLSYNKFGLNLGAGVVALFSPRVGVRGDIRYFRRLETKSDGSLLPIASNFDFFRAVGALSLRF